jgi:hypothetical protein
MLRRTYHVTSKHRGAYDSRESPVRKKSRCSTTNDTATSAACPKSTQAGTTSWAADKTQRMMEQTVSAGCASRHKRDWTTNKLNCGNRRDASRYSYQLMRLRDLQSSKDATARFWPKRTSIPSPGLRAVRTRRCVNRMPRIITAMRGTPVRSGACNQGSPLPRARPKSVGHADAIRPRPTTHLGSPSQRTIRPIGSPLVPQSRRPSA